MSPKSKYGFDNLVPGGSSNTSPPVTPLQPSAERPSPPAIEESSPLPIDDIFVERSRWKRKLLTVSAVVLGIAGGSYLICGSKDDSAKKKSAPAGQTAKPSSTKEGQTELPPQQPAEPQTTAKGFDIHCKIFYDPVTGVRSDCEEQPGAYTIEFDGKASQPGFLTSRLVVDKNGDGVIDAKCPFVLKRPKNPAEAQELHRTEEDKPLKCLPIDNK